MTERQMIDRFKLAESSILLKTFNCNSPVRYIKMVLNISPFITILYDKDVKRFTELQYLNETDKIKKVKL